MSGGFQWSEIELIINIITFNFQGSLPYLNTLQDLKGTKACFAGVGTQVTISLLYHYQQSNVILSQVFKAYNKDDNIHTIKIF